MHQRSIYLKTRQPNLVLAELCAEIHVQELVGCETISTHQALGRVLAEPVHANLSLPPAHLAAMDGYAVVASSTFGARQGKPLALRIGHEAFAVNTGHALPRGCDAVIMIEEAPEHDGCIHIEAACAPWQHVRRMGEEIVASELLLPRQHQIKAWDIGTLLAAGVWQVCTYAPIRACIIPTGDEVLRSTSRQKPQPGQVVDSNSPMLAALCEANGAIATCFDPVPDVQESLHQALCTALEGPEQVILLCAGSSAGSKDFTRSIIEREGRILAHGLSLMPGKPSIISICRGKAVIGVPGYPVSALACFEEIVAPLLAFLQHRQRPDSQEIQAELSRSVPSRPGVEELIRLNIGRVGSHYVASPLPRGAANIRSVTRSQGFVRVPANAEGLEQGRTITTELCVPRQQLDHVLLMVGSHDNSLDLLGDALMARKEPVHLSSNHVGSMGGFTALKLGHCLCAGMHVFDPQSGDFTFPFIPSLLPQTPVNVLNLAIRQQGLIVPKGNPLGIKTLTDLTRVRFINRQRGSGTRILFDWMLQQAGITPQAINGYAKEEYTHMALAMNILMGEADAGLGIYAAAKALDLDFIPLVKERYDIVIPKAFWDDPRIAAMRDIIQSSVFKQQLEGLGGYECQITGQLMQAGQGLTPA